MPGVLNIDLIGLIVGAVITLMIFSYLLGDNFLYRIALALLVGGGIGYATGITMRALLLRWLDPNLEQAAKIYFVVFLILGIPLIFKIAAPTTLLGRLAPLGNIPLAYLMGVGTAVAISGALLGTLLPQIQATGDALTFRTLLTGVLMVLGTITSLFAFSPGKRQNDGDARLALVNRWVGRVGQLFITIALASAFAGAITSGLTMWVERWAEIIALIGQFVPLGGG